MVKSYSLILLWYVINCKPDDTHAAHGHEARLYGAAENLYADINW